MTIKLYNNDCLKILPLLGDASFDAVITDPPYGTSDDRSRVTRIGNDISEFHHDWDETLPTEWISDAFRVTKPGGSIVVWTDTKMVTHVWEKLEEHGFHALNCIFWYKGSAPPNPRKNFCSAVEAAVFARKKGKIIHWGGGGATQNFFQCSGESFKVHPTQKPIKLMRWIVSIVAPDGGSVIDPFMGSGTTGVACAERKIDFVGIEMDKKYFQDAEKRISTAESQEDIFFSVAKKTQNLGFEF